MPGAPNKPPAPAEVPVLPTARSDPVERKLVRRLAPFRVALRLDLWKGSPHPDLTTPLLAELAALDDAAFRAKFSGSPIKRIGRDRFVRNVAIAIGNSAAPALLPASQALTEDADPVVAEAGGWAVARLLSFRAQTS